MDGNGRWAASRRLPRVAGHREGARAVRRAIEAAIQSGVVWLTIYAFSSENWLFVRGPGASRTTLSVPITVRSRIIGMTVTAR